MSSNMTAAQLRGCFAQAPHVEILILVFDIESGTVTLGYGGPDVLLRHLLSALEIPATELGGNVFTGSPASKTDYAALGYLPRDQNRLIRLAKFLKKVVMVYAMYDHGGMQQRLLLFEALPTGTIQYPV